MAADEEPRPVGAARPGPRSGHPGPTGDPAPTREPVSASTRAPRPAAEAGSGVAPAPTHPRRLRAEVLLVLGLSVGQSAVYAVVSIISRITAETPLGQQSATLNPSRSPRPLLDLTYQLLGIGFALVPVALARFLLSEPGRSAVRRIGLDRGRPVRDLGAGLGLAALIGIPGLGLYVVGRALGVTVQVHASALNALWWTVPVLIL